MKETRIPLPPWFIEVIKDCSTSMQNQDFKCFHARLLKTDWESNIKAALANIDKLFNHIGEQEDVRQLYIDLVMLVNNAIILASQVKKNLV